jgi:steroid delta-isomerase-like uncharacterized protein
VETPPAPGDVVQKASGGNTIMAAASDIQRQVLEAWNARDFDKMRAMLHPDYTYLGPDGQLLQGPDAGMALAQGYATAFPDGRLEIERIHAAGDTSIAEMVARGTHQGALFGIPATGKKVEIRICNVQEMRDGKLYREREYMDVLTMMTQIGAVTPPGGH